MKTDCVFYDNCETKDEGCCPGSIVVMGDICSRCGEHCNDGCEDCNEYTTEDDLKEREGENKYQSNKEDNVKPE